MLQALKTLKSLRSLKMATRHFNGGKYLIRCAIFFCKVKVKLLGRVLLFATPRTVAYQAPPSMGFSSTGEFQYRILEWVAISFSSGSS